MDAGRLLYFGGVAAAMVAAHGVGAPVWALLLPVLVAVAFADAGWKALSYGVLGSVLVFVTAMLSHDVGRATIVSLLLPVVALPATSWVVAVAASSLQHLNDVAAADRARGAEEGEQLRAQLMESARAERETLLDETRRERAELKAKVDKLSDSLAAAARGDLSGYGAMGWGAAATAEADETLAALQSAFTNTLGNLRLLVEQIRGSGESISASAGELLATAEEHAALEADPAAEVSFILVMDDRIEVVYSGNRRPRLAFDRDGTPCTPGVKANPKGRSLADLIFRDDDQQT